MRETLTLVSAIARFGLVSAQPDRLAKFYTEALGFQERQVCSVPQHELALLGWSGSAQRTTLTLNDQRIDLDCFDEPGRSIRSGARSCDTDFQHFALVTSDAAASWRRARDCGATAISMDGPVKLPARSGGVTAIKFRDPEGHPLELLQFPQDSEGEWNGQGILGIDHTAISVVSLEDTVQFYENLGLVRGDATLNRGPAQAELDGLTEPIADVLPLHVQAGPAHLELLHYRQPTPTTGPSVVVNDIAATRTVWQADSDAMLQDPSGHIHLLMRHPFTR